MISLLIWILSGIFAGWAAAKLMSLDSSNWVKNLVLGLIGSLVGSLVGGLIGIRSSNLIGSVIISFLGGCLAVWVYQKYINK